MRNINRRFLFSLFFTSLILDLHCQINLRIFSDKNPGSVIFSVSSGEYTLNSYDGDTLTLLKDELVLVARLNNRLAVKTRGSRAFMSDSIILSPVRDESSFSVRLDGESITSRYYSGHLRLKADLGTIMMINSCDYDSYIAGVVRAEGGSGRNREYYKTQAVIARTYMYKYNGKHAHDGYSLCDNTHCQAYNGLVTDTVIINAVKKTKDIVIMDSDSTLIISAFHSNCGGETASSEDVWLTGVPYLKKISDPYCRTSRNASWEKIIPATEWTRAVQKLSHSEISQAQLLGTGFSQNTRSPYYKTGGLSIPFSDLRTELNLRSAFFSVMLSGENIVLNGRGYGHGVGLCQEGAMNMASKGFSYTDIIKFYYTDVIISDVSSSKPDVPVR